jgi:hypothetical protein
LTSCIVLAAGLAVLAQAARLDAEPTEAKPAPKPITIDSLSMEVNALQTLRQLQLDKGQLEKLRGWAEEAAAKDQQRKPGAASAAYREKMAALRKALQEAKDADLIAKLNEEADELREKEKPTLDGGVDVTDAARKRAPEAYRLTSDEFAPRRFVPGFPAQTAEQTRAGPRVRTIVHWRNLGG